MQQHGGSFVLPFLIFPFFSIFPLNVPFPAGSLRNSKLQKLLVKAFTKYCTSFLKQILDLDIYLRAVIIVKASLISV